MRSLRFLFLVVVFPAISFAQITIDNGDMPQAGDTIRLSTAYDISGLDFSSTGPNFNWDFSELQPALQRVDTFVSVQETPWVYQLIFFLSANLAKKQLEFDQIPGFEVTDVYEYYKNQSSDFRSVGFGITLNSIPLPNKYNDPDIIFKFPINYGNQDSSYATYGIDIPGIGYTGGWKKRVNYVDGWGTLTTPFGSFETVRLKSEVLQFDSLYIDSLGFGIPIYRQYTEYKWLGENKGLPLLKVTDDGLLPSYLYMDSVRMLTTGGVNPAQLKAEINLFPNPSDGLLNITIKAESNASIDVLFIDAEGRQVYQHNLQGRFQNKKQVQINLRNKGFEPGFYYAIIRQENRIAIKKLVIQ
ncbi:MAG: T9SS type A sorting domain-containing protein [Bacteroidales bacterium]|nr:T9SS type A sorting domain-containing protein [Bacteroidales bacterium]